MAENVPDSSEYSTETNIEDLTSRFKRSFDSWKHVLVRLNSIFIWEQQFHPVILTGIVTVIFSIIWILDPSVLTAVSALGIIFTIVDYLVPIVCNNFLDTTQWSQKSEQKYTEICSELALAWVTLVSGWKGWQKVKDSKPKIYFTSLLATLFILAWIGNLINNLFLTYLIAVFIVLLPGLKHHGLLQKYASEAAKMIRATVGKKDKQQ